MTSDRKAPQRGSEPRATRHPSVPKQESIGDAIGGWDEKLLPAASRPQWSQMQSMRTMCLFTAYKFVPWDDREDVWQETRLALWRQLLKGPIDQLWPYVRTTCANAAKQHLKKVKTRAEQFIGDDIEELETPVFDERTDARIRELLVGFRPELTEHEARIFVLRMGLKWSIKMVAEALEITEDAVKSAHRSAKRKLLHPETQNAVFRRLNPE
ncbi:sigma-70 family RNA polymerase sigma factor [Streptomyces sp. NPDC007851]|uniref:sigma-70 family RNA polymerase sigma factor n=1 Tax=Streptomyces sp. NPDC007851 TaxID=3155008 RepID=UPI0033DFF146